MASRVLVIDDDDVVRELMCQLFRERHCEVIGANSPIGVSKLIVARHIELVIIDVMMPDLSGDKLVRLLRGNPKLKQLTIVMVSSSNPDELERIAKEVNADAVVSKSVLREELAITALAALRRKALSRTILA